MKLQDTFLTKSGSSQIAPPLGIPHSSHCNLHSYHIISIHTHIISIQTLIIVTYTNLATNILITTVGTTRTQANTMSWRPSAWKNQWRTSSIHTMLMPPFRDTYTRTNAFHLFIKMWLQITLPHISLLVLGDNHMVNEIVNTAFSTLPQFNATLKSLFSLYHSPLLSLCHHISSLLSLCLIHAIPLSLCLIYLVLEYWEQKICRMSILICTLLLPIPILCSSSWQHDISINSYLYLLIDDISYYLSIHLFFHI